MIERKNSKGEVLNMTVKIIPFRTREQWELEKQEKLKKEWERYLLWEQEALKLANKKKSQHDGFNGLSDEDLAYLEEYIDAQINKS